MNARPPRAQARHHIRRNSGIVGRWGKTMHLKLPPPE
jgi:hypothetical protein